MLEILLLVYLCKRLGAMLRARGRSAGLWQLLLVVCWFGGEFVGMLAMAVILGEFNATAYIGGLLGAAGGTVVVFVLANHLTAVNDCQQYVSGAFPVAPANHGGSAPPPPI